MLKKIIGLKNVGGLVMPVILKLTFEDGSEEIRRLPVEIWARNNESTSTSIVSEKVLKSIELDPFRETADVNRDNNFYPPRLEPSRFQLYKGSGDRRGGGDNPMRAAKRREEAQKKAEEAKKKAEEAKKKADAEKAAQAEKSETNVTTSKSITVTVKATADSNEAAEKSEKTETSEKKSKKASKKKASKAKKSDEA